MDNSIENEDICELNTHIQIDSPWKSATKNKAVTNGLTPKKTPVRQIVVNDVTTPNSINSKLREIGNYARENIGDCDCVSPTKFYKNMTSTQKIDQNCLNGDKSLSTLDETKIVNYFAAIINENNSIYLDKS